MHINKCQTPRQQILTIALKTLDTYTNKQLQL